MNVVPFHTPSTFSIALRQARMAAGLSQNQLATIAGINAAYVNRLENGKQANALVSAGVVLDLAAACNVSDIEADRWLILNGHCPTIIARLSSAQFAALYTLLVATAQPGQARVAR